MNDVNNNYFTRRIEPVDDKHVNDMLFILYEKLIAPIKEIEELQERIWSREDLIKESSTFKIKTLKAKFHIILAIIIAALSLYVDSIRSEKADVIYNNSIELQQMYIDSDEYFITEYFNPLYESTMFVMEKIEPRLSKMGFFTEFFASFLVLGITLFTLGLLFQLPLIAVLTIIKNYKDKAIIKRCTAENQVAHEKLSAIFDSIEQYIAFVPPSYRTSSALTYFVDSYANTRVNNLKEAVNAYDLYIRDAKMNDNIRQISGQLSSIAFNQVTMIDQLNTLHKDIWRAGFLFS